MAATLYRVQTRTDAIEGYDHVLITWAAAGRTAPVAPYADVIEGLGPGDEADLFRRNAVDELFTFEKAQAWVAYLQRHYSNESSEVVEQPLPLPGNAVALSDMPGAILTQEGHKLIEFLELVSPEVLGRKVPDGGFE